MKKILILILALLFSSCKIDEFFNEVDNYIESIHFLNDNYTVKKDSLVSCSIICNPSDAIGYYSVNFYLSDETVAKIIKQDERSVVIQGLKEGSAILNAEMGNKKCYCIINVKEI